MSIKIIRERGYNGLKYRRLYANGYTNATTVKFMKKISLIIVILAVLFTAFSCSTIRYVPVSTDVNEITRYIDSLRIKDSTVVIPVERIVDIVPSYDTLTMETTLSISKSYVDTLTHSLKGSLENKKGVEYKYVYRDRIVEKTDTVNVYKEIPVEVPKVVYKTPKWAWWTLVLFILFIALVGLKLYLKIKG